MNAEDRELLELAAKAAHLFYVWRPFGGFIEQNGPRPWNPLNNDGDAFWLAVKCGVMPQLFNGMAVIGDIREGLGADAYAATRRAIVRAAAERGRRMP